MFKAEIVIVLLCSADGLTHSACVQEYYEVLLQLIVSTSLLLWLHAMWVSVLASSGLCRILLALQKLDWEFVQFPENPTIFSFLSGKMVLFIFLTKGPQEQSPDARYVLMFNKEAMPALKKLTIMTRKSKMKSMLEFLMPSRVSQAELNGQK